MADIAYLHGRPEIRRARYASLGNVVAGMWLVVAPFVLGFEGAELARWNHIIVGAAVLIMAGVRAADPDQREAMSWLNVALGIWMIVAPYALDYARVPSAQLNSIIVGVIVLALGAFSAYETNQGIQNGHRARSTSRRRVS